MKDAVSTKADEALDLDTPLRALLNAQRSDFLASGPPSLAERRDRLDRLILLLTENADAFSEALNADFGNRPHVMNLMNEVAGILPDLTLTRRQLPKWMGPQRVSRIARMLGLSTVVEKNPVGVVGVIGPWNFPIALATEPAASALAAGNRVMIKMSEMTPRTADLFANEVADYFDPTEMTAVTGGPDVGAAFASLPFDHLFFTGSSEVGKLVASAAARNLVPVTLELGGRNPAVIAKDADIAAMARRVMAARMCNGGQICLCPEYAFVPRDQVNKFVDAALDTARSAATADNGDGLVAIINDKSYERVKALIDDARSLGATVLDAGTPFDPDRRRIPPTVLLDLRDDMRIASNEVFGPALSVLPYDTIEQVVDYVRRRPTPLAAYWYGPAGADFEHFRARTASGGMTVNDFAIHCAMMGAPFGGLGHSGWGGYHGKTGFDTFTHQRTVTVSRLPVSIAQLITPPYPAALKPAISSYIAFERWRATRRRARRARVPG